MIPGNFFISKKKQGEYQKYSDRQGLLNHLQLQEIEWTSIALKPIFIRRNLKNILEHGNTPADQNNGNKSEAPAPFHILKFQMPIPGQGHENIGNTKQGNC